MYEILTLTRVFDATNQLKLALKITTCDVSDISVENYSDELRKLVKRLLSKDPKLRPSNLSVIEFSM